MNRQSPKFEIGDLLRNNHDDLVTVTNIEKLPDGTVVYYWKIPERRGGSPEHLLQLVVKSRL